MPFIRNYFAWIVVFFVQDAAWSSQGINSAPERTKRGPRALGSTLVPTPWPEVVPGAVPGEPQEKPTRSQGSPRSRRSQKRPRKDPLEAPGDP